MSDWHKKPSRPTTQHQTGTSWNRNSFWQWQPLVWLKNSRTRKGHLTATVLIRWETWTPTHTQVYSEGKLACPCTLTAPAATHNKHTAFNHDVTLLLSNVCQTTVQCVCMCVCFWLAICLSLIFPKPQRLLLRIPHEPRTASIVCLPRNSLPLSTLD